MLAMMLLEFVRQKIGEIAATLRNIFQKMSEREAEIGPSEYASENAARPRKYWYDVGIFGDSYSETPQL